MTTWQKYPHSRGVRPIEGMSDADIVKYAEFVAAGLTQAALDLNAGKMPLVELRIQVTLAPEALYCPMDDSGQDA